MRSPASAAFLLLASCMYGLQGEIQNVRLEIARMERQLPPEAPLWIHEGPDRFDRFLEDYTPRVPDFIYVHLVRKLHALGPAEAEGLSQGPFDAGACAADPVKFRGRTWKVGGVIAEFHAEPLEDDRSPVRQVHSGVLFDGAGRPILFHVIRKPEVLSLREDHVELHGVFVKMIEYTTHSGRRIAAPFFVANTLRRFL